MHHTWALFHETEKKIDCEIQCLYYLKNCLANESASLNMACSEESLKHSELALLDAELSCREDPAVSEWMCPRPGGVADLEEGSPFR